MQYFADCYGYSPAETLICATRNGGLTVLGTNEDEGSRLGTLGSDDHHSTP